MVDREELHELARDMLANGALITEGSLVMMACEEIDRLREALEPFGEIAHRLGWKNLTEDDREFGDHIIEAPAEDIAPGAAYCLMVSAFVAAWRALHDQQ